MSGAGPGPALVLVATPIGNLGDLSPRAAEVLAQADVVCCEDTRRTRALLSAAGIAGAGRLVAVHAHNEAARAAEVRDWLDQGRLVALVTDAGTPGVSDPGRRLVVAAADAGHRVTAVPGPSAVLAALSLSGLDTDRFSVEGFLPRKGAARRERLAALSRAPVTTVVLEAPTRLAATLAELAGAGPDRPVCVARELTKVHEEVWRGTLAEAVTHFAAAPVKGEVVLVLGAVPPVAPGTDEVTALARARLEAGESPRAAAEHVAAALGVSRRVAYEAALAARDEAGAD